MWEWHCQQPLGALAENMQRNRKWSKKNGEWQNHSELKFTDEKKFKESLWSCGRSTTAKNFTSGRKGEAAGRNPCSFGMTRWVSMGVIIYLCNFAIHTRSTEGKKRLFARSKPAVNTTKTPPLHCAHPQSNTAPNAAMHRTVSVVNVQIKCVVISADHQSDAFFTCCFFAFLWMQWRTRATSLRTPLTRPIQAEAEWAYRLHSETTVDPWAFLMPHRQQRRV